MRICCLAIGLALFLLVNSVESLTASAAPQKIFAISHQNFSGGAGNPSDTIQFYDVTSIEAGGATNVFNNSPMFSVWLGFEIFEGQELNSPTGLPTGNQEDVSAITFNPANGTIYAAAFDSTPGAAGDPDEVGDSTGDWDLFRIDYQELLNDFVTNSRPAGTIYAPRARIFRLPTKRSCKAMVVICLMEPSMGLPTTSLTRRHSPGQSTLITPYKKWASWLALNRQ